MEIKLQNLTECKKCTSTDIEENGLCDEHQPPTEEERQERIDKFVLALSDALHYTGEQFGNPFQTKLDDGKRKLEFIGFDGSPCLDVVVDYGD